MWPAWFYLSGIVPLATARTLINELNARAKIAREAPFDRNVKKQWVSRIQQVRASRSCRFPMRKHCVSDVSLKFDVEIAENR